MTEERKNHRSDLIKWFCYSSSVGKSPKLIDKYNGPYYISYNLLKLRNCDTHKELQSYVNASRLKEYSQGENIRDQYPVQDFFKIIRTVMVMMSITLFLLLLSKKQSQKFIMHTFQLINC